MTTIRDIIARVTSQYNAGVASDDSRLRRRLAWAKILDAYTDLVNDPRIRIKQSDFSRTTLDCVQMIPSTPYECDCIPDLGCKVYRSKYKLPRPLKSSGKLQFGPVRTIDGMKEYTVVALAASTYTRFAKYGGQIEKAIIKNDYLYVITKTEEELLSVTLIPENPLDVAEFKTKCEDCSPTTNCLGFLDQPFGMDPDIINKVVNMAVDSLKLMFNPSDNSNDGADNKGT